MNSYSDYEWDIIYTIADCFTNPNNPIFPDRLQFSEYNSKVHQNIHNIPLEARHLMVFETALHLALLAVGDELRGDNINPTRRLYLEKKLSSIENDIAMLGDLSHRIMAKILIEVDVNIEEVDIYLLENWQFTYSINEKIVNHSNISLLKMDSNRTLH